MNVMKCIKMINQTVKLNLMMFATSLSFNTINPFVTIRFTQSMLQMSD